MTASEVEFLLTLYKVTQKQPGLGAETKSISKFLGLTPAETNKVLTTCIANKLISKGSSTITLTRTGEAYINAYLTQNRFLILKLSNPEYIPPSITAELGYKYNYFVSEQQNYIAEGTVTVLVSTVLATLLGIDIDRNSPLPAENVLLLIAALRIKHAIKDGKLSSALTIKVSTKEKDMLPYFEQKNLVAIKEAEFFVTEPAISPYTKKANESNTPPSDNHKDLKYDRDMDWYTNPKNIPNQNLVTSTIEFIEKHHSTRVTPLDFLNLLYRQIDLLKQSLRQPNFFLQQLKSLPIPVAVSNTLFAAILKWHGGSPINNLNEDYDTILKLIEADLKSTFEDEESPEIIFSQGDKGFREKLDKLGAAFTNALNDGSELPQEEKSEETPIETPSKELFSEDMEIQAFTSKIIIKEYHKAEPVMGVSELANVLGTLLHSMKAEKGQMIGIFGKWGRGKTYFINQLKEALKKYKKPEFIHVDFHAWKYQETPASWAYLYEQFVESYLGKKKNLPYAWKLLKLNCHRHGFWPLFKFFIAIVTTVIAIIASFHFIKKEVPQQNWVIYGSVSLTITLSATYLTTAFKKLSPKAVALIKLYNLRNSFKDSLGIQADIQKELKKLLTVWIPKKKLNKEIQKIILYVEDIDRCTEEKIMQNIDALRILLEDDEIARRVLIVTAIDERILKNAIVLKYDKVFKTSENYKLFDDKPQVFPLIKEYIDKLFISAIKLGDLTEVEIVEYLHLLLKDDLPLNTVKENNENVQNDNTLIQGSIGGNTLSFTTNSDPSEAHTTNEPPAETVPVAKNQTNNIEPSDFRLTPIEVKCLQLIYTQWADATPRQMRIFYLRYQLAKNLLILRYKAMSRQSIWQTNKGISITLQAIQHYSTANHIHRVSDDRISILRKGDTMPLVPFMSDNTTAPMQDIAYLLEVLEIVIAY